MLDPRLYAIDRRLRGVGRIVAVTGGKGGVGKSFVAAGIASALTRGGRPAGLLDLDLTSPSSHLFLGFDTHLPTEKVSGIDPVVAGGVVCLSIALFGGSYPLPLRGEDVTNVFVELLTITRWGDLDVLVVDMPPGIGDAALDAIRLLPRAEYVVVAGSSKVVLASVERTVRLLSRLERPVIGVLENMQRGDAEAVAAFAREAGLPYLGAVPFDEGLEASVGDPERFAATRAWGALRDALLPVLS